MKTRLQDIRDKVNNAQYFDDKEIKYLLDALEQAQELIDSQKQFIESVAVNLQQSQEENYNLLEKVTNDCLMCDKMDMAMLHGENEGLKQELLQAQVDYRDLESLDNDRIKQIDRLLKTNSDNVKKLDEYQDRERVLREALGKVESMALTGELFGQKVYSMFSDDREEVLKALNQEATNDKN